MTPISLRLAQKLAITLLLPLAVFGQNIEKHPFSTGNPANYYLAIKPKGPIKGVLVLLNTNFAPESIPPETRLHNVASNNSILTIYSTIPGLVPDTASLNRITQLFQSVATDFSADTARFILGGFGFAGNTVLRYTELACQHPDSYPVRPKAVFTIGSFVDLPELYNWCGRQVRKNFYGGNVGDARFLLDYFKKHDPALTPAELHTLTPFTNADTLGNERSLMALPVRLYYDGEPFWELQSRHNSLYDNPIAGGTELVSRLLQAGNDQAELRLSRQPGYRSNGVRNPVSISIVDETECIQWITGVLNILNPALPQNWKAPYNFPVPEKWTVERTEFPPPFSPNVPYKGFEEIHFPPGWGDVATEDYWTVSYLFRLEGKQQMDAPRLQDFIKAYFDGLIADNVRRRNIPKEKLVPISATLTKTKTEKGDLETYTGTIAGFDYMAQVPMPFHCRIHLKPGGESFTPLLIEISPKPFDHPIWGVMEATTTQFECGTKKAL